MVFVLFLLVSIFVYLHTNNFKLALILFNIGLSWSLISVVFSKDEEEYYIEKEIAKGVNKHVNTRFSELKKQTAVLEQKLKLSENNRNSIENELDKIRKQKGSLEEELNKRKLYNNENELILNNKITKLNLRIQSMQNQIKTYSIKDKNLEDLENKLEQKRSELSALKLKEKQYKQLLENDIKLQDDIEYLNRQIDIKTHSLEKALEENKKVRKTLKEYESKLKNNKSILNNTKQTEVEILRNKLLTVNSESLGRNLESKFRHVLSSFVTKDLKGKNLYYKDLVGVKKYDNYQGTDFILFYDNFEIRIDITARDESQKDNMYALKKYKLFKTYIRTGNVVSKFEEDVLVYVVPYYDEETIIESMIEIYNNIEDTVDIFMDKKRGIV